MLEANRLDLLASTERLRRQLNDAHRETQALHAQVDGLVRQITDQRVELA